VIARTARQFPLVIALVVTLALIPAALAAKGGGGGKGGGKTGTTPTGSFSLVLENSTDGLPHYGQTVTFNVSTTASMPGVTLTCYQNGDWVVNQTVGFYPGYPWSQDFYLFSSKWAGGAADCTATLFSGSTTLATMSFHVYE